MKKNIVTKFIKDNRGVAAVELACILPMILLMFFGAIEISNFVLVNQRTEKMSNTIGDMVAQYTAISTKDLNLILAATGDIMQPFPFADQGYVIITAVNRKVGEGPKVAWQYEGGGTLKNMKSNFGNPGFASPLPTGFTLNERETVIIAEVYYNYKPFITSQFMGKDSNLYKVAFYKPRLGSLDTVASVQ